MLRDGIARLETALRDHITDVREHRKEVRQEIAAIKTELDALQLWKAKVVGVAGFIGFLSSFLTDWVRHFISK